MQTIAAQEQELSVGELIISSDQTAPQTRVSTVAELFFSTTDLDAIAVVEGSEPVGLVTRTKLLFTLFRRFSFELYGKHPIIAIADTSPLIVSENERLDVIIDKALDRSPQDIYDEIIVTSSQGVYKGLLSVKQLVIQQSNALASNVMQKEIASARAKELEKINQVKSQFLANVTHELRSPVNAIIGLAELLRMSADKGSIEQIKERLSFMISSATNLRTVITNILDLSKIEAGKMEVAHQDVNVVSLLAEIAETTRILIGNKSIAVQLMAPALPVTITTDPIKLRQILMNLVSNAAKFTESGRIDLTLSILGSSMTIAVSDTGMGIKEEDLHKLFTAFGQIEDVKTKKHEGTGLGLTISKNLAELIGGSISITSTYGQGTTFIVSLPIQDISRERAIQCRNRKRVLVVDDDEMHLYTTKELLQSDRIAVSTHKNWLGATNRVKDFEPDLVLLDINMPGLSGDKLTEIIKPYCDSIHAPIVFHSSNDEDSLRELVKKHGVSGYICKGNVIDLRSKVNQYLKLNA